MTSPARHYAVGATVFARDGQLGILEAVLPGEGPTEPGALLVQPAGEARRLIVPLALVDTAASTPSAIRLAGERADLLALAQQTEAARDRVVVPVHEERLVPATRDVELGTVRIHKRVEPVPVETAVELASDEVTVERVPVHRPVTTAPDPYYDGETLVVPLVEEVLVTERRLEVREEVRITRRRVTEQVPVRETLRREVVEVEGQGNITAAPPRPRKPRRPRKRQDQDHG